MTIEHDLNSWTDTLLALSIRVKMNECPICHALLYDGMSHDPTCRLYAIEMAAQEMWPKPWEASVVSQQRIMKKTIQKETHVCDKCGKEESYITACMNCGTEMCYECLEKHGKKYNHAIYFQGSGDGSYCKACDVKLTASGTDKRHNAYRAIKSLKDELEAWHTDFKKRQAKAENAVNDLQTIENKCDLAIDVRARLI